MFEKFLFQPIYNVLILIATLLPQPDLGVSVIILVIWLRVLLWPLFHKIIVSQLVIKKIQPEIERIRKVYRDDQLTQTKELLKLYQQNNFNPFTLFVGLLVQLPILFALYRVFLKIAQGVDASLLYPGISSPSLQTLFLSRFELTQPDWFLSLIAALSQAGYSLFSSSTKSQTRVEGLMPWLSFGLTLLVVSRLPSVLALYWSVSTVITLFQQLITEKLIKNNDRVNRQT